MPGILKNAGTYLLPPFLSDMGIFVLPKVALKGHREDKDRDGPPEQQILQAPIHLPVVEIQVL